MIFTNIDDPNETYTVEYGTSYNIELPKGKTFSVTIEGEPDVCTTTDSSEIEILHNRYDQTQNLRFVLIENMRYRVLFRRSRLTIPELRSTTTTAR